MTRPWELFRFLRTAARNFLEDNCLDRAAAVAFYSLLSLAPALYLLSRLVRAFLPEESQGISPLPVLDPFLPASLVPLLARVAESLRFGQGLVPLAVPGLVWVATSAFLSLEYAVNVAFRTVESRLFWLARAKAFASSIIAGSLLLASAATSNALAWIDGARARAGLPGSGAGMAAMAAMIQLAVTLGAMALLYKVLPRGNVKWRWAAASASLSVVLWEAARRVFGAILARSPSYGLVTGSLAAVVALLLWVYTAVAILLLGAEFAAVLNGNRSANRRESRGTAAP